MALFVIKPMRRAFILGNETAAEEATAGSSAETGVETGAKTA
jgi:OFA family oxalate/formate antiporter-like MFS transporter